jgi:hypothetical protein
MNNQTINLQPGQSMTLTVAVNGSQQAQLTINAPKAVAAAAVATTGMPAGYRVNAARKGRALQKGDQVINNFGALGTVTAINHRTWDSTHRPYTVHFKGVPGALTYQRGQLTAVVVNNAGEKREFKVSADYRATAVAGSKTVTLSHQQGTITTDTIRRIVAASEANASTRQTTFRVASRSIAVNRGSDRFGVGCQTVQVSVLRELLAFAGV